jgi:hypothetical protein
MTQLAQDRRKTLVATHVDQLTRARLLVYSSSTLRISPYDGCKIHRPELSAERVYRLQSREES